LLLIKMRRSVDRAAADGSPDVDQLAEDAGRVVARTRSVLGGEADGFPEQVGAAVVSQRPDARDLDDTDVVTVIGGPTALSDYVQRTPVHRRDPRTFLASVKSGVIVGALTRRNDSPRLTATWVALIPIRRHGRMVAAAHAVCG